MTQTLLSIRLDTGAEVRLDTESTSPSGGVVSEEEIRHLVISSTILEASYPGGAAVFKLLTGGGSFERSGMVALHRCQDAK